MADKEKNNVGDIYDSEGYRKDITPDQKKSISNFLEKEKSLEPISEVEINHFRKVLFKNLKTEIAEKIIFEILTGEGGIISFKPLTQNEETELFYYYLSDFLKDYQEVKTLIFWEELGQRLTNSKFTKKAYASMKAEIKKIKEEEQPLENNLKEITPYNLNNITIEKFYIPNTKVSNYITDEFLDYGKQQLDVGSKKKNISAYCTLTYEGDNVTLSGKKPFTAFDREIYNALTSLFVADNKYFTTGTVFRALTGRKGKDKPSANMKKEIEESIEKCMFIKMTLDCTEQLKERKLDVTKGRIISNLLKADILDMGEKKERVYRFNDDPLPLYQYANAIKQVIPVPVEYLDTKDLGSDTKNNILIKNFLLKEIEVIKGPTARSNKILYSSLFKKTQIENVNKVEKKRYRDYIKSLLEYWIQMKSIKGYKEYKKGKNIAGIEIIY